MTQPLVSIHLMTYNQVKFIEDTIQSALDQTYEAIEIVVGDDGSTDGTTEIVERLAKAYPDKIKRAGGVHVGINANANRILKACMGKYVAILNGDDLFHPDKIAKQVQWMEADQRRVLCGHDVGYFTEDATNPFKNQSDVGPMRSGAGAEDFLMYGVPFATVSVMVRRDAMPDYGFDPQLKVCLDWKMWIDCLAAGGHFGFVDGVLGSYRVHSENSTSTWPEQIWIDAFVGLGLVEARYPHLAKACQAARARRYYQRGVAAVQGSEGSAARLALVQSLRYDPTLSWKVYAWLCYNEATNPNHLLGKLGSKLLRRNTP